MIIELAEGNADFPYLCTDYHMVIGPAADGKRDPGMNRVMLLTDGQANVGLVEPSQLLGLAEADAEMKDATSS